MPNFNVIWLVEPLQNWGQKLTKMAAVGVPHRLTLQVLFSISNSTKVVALVMESVSTVLKEGHQMLKKPSWFLVIKTNRWNGKKSCITILKKIAFGGIWLPVSWKWGKTVVISIRWKIRQKISVFKRQRMISNSIKDIWPDGDCAFSVLVTVQTTRAWKT